MLERLRPVFRRVKKSLAGSIMITVKIEAGASISRKTRLLSLRTYADLRKYAGFWSTN